MKINGNCLEFNIDILKKGITNYQQNFDNDPNYIIMSEETKRVLKEKCQEYPNFKTITWTAEDSWGIAGKNKGYEKYCVFWGIPIAICDNLKFGEVDII